MKLVYKTDGNVTLADLDQLAVTYSGIVNIGRKCKEVWNTIAIEDDSIDPFQCNLIGAVGGSWRLRMARIARSVLKDYSVTRPYLAVLAWVDALVFIQARRVTISERQMYKPCSTGNHWASGVK